MAKTYSETEVLTIAKGVMGAFMRQYRGLAPTETELQEKRGLIALEAGEAGNVPTLAFATDILGQDLSAPIVAMRGSQPTTTAQIAAQYGQESIIDFLEERNIYLGGEGRGAPASLARTYRHEALAGKIEAIAREQDAARSAPQPQRPSLSAAAPRMALRTSNGHS
ncbi:MAG: hypothetical protein WDO70_04090 [Alphaproteobacteria bacterium]